MPRLQSSVMPYLKDILHIYQTLQATLLIYHNLDLKQIEIPQLAIILILAAPEAMLWWWYDPDKDKGKGVRTTVRPPSVVGGSLLTSSSRGHPALRGVRTPLSSGTRRFLRGNTHSSTLTQQQPQEEACPQHSLHHLFHLSLFLPPSLIWIHSHSHNPPISTSPLLCLHPDHTSSLQQSAVEFTSCF